MSLEISGITKAYGGLVVLHDVSMTVGTDALVGLIGPNGAGKSTLFAVVSGFTRPTAGTVRFEGRSLDRLAPPARVRLGLARTFQVPREFQHLTVLENLCAAAPRQSGERLWTLCVRPGRVRAEEEAIHQRARGWLEFLNLARVADARAGTLSGGQKKLLELGRVLMLEPRMVLLDEPFAGVNPVLIGEIAERIGELHRRGIGFVIVEHHLQALSALVKDLYVMDRGAILAQGSPQAVLADHAVREAYMGGVA